MRVNMKQNTMSFVVQGTIEIDFIQITELTKIWQQEDPGEPNFETWLSKYLSGSAVAVEKKGLEKCAIKLDKTNENNIGDSF
jgi:hypothetical protein